MKTFLKKQSSIVVIPSNFATLEEIVDNKFRYKVRYLADPALAIQEKAITVKIHVSKQSYIKKVQPIFSVINSSNIIFNLLKKNALQKDIARSAVSQYILTYISDISSKIPNNTTLRLSLARFGQNIPIRFSKILSPKPVSDLTDQNVNMPVMDTNLNKVSEKLLNDQQIKQASMSMLYISKIDPASLVNKKTNVIRSAQRAMDGVNTKPTFLQTQTSKNNSLGSALISSLLNNNINTSQIELQGNEFLNVFEHKEQTLVEVTEFIDIPVNSLSEGEFYFIFELINNKGLSIQINSNLVNHSRNLLFLRIPTEIPEIKVLPVNNPGKVSFTITQKDRNAIGVNIYRREIKPGQNNINSEYIYVGKTDIAFGQPAQKVEDLVASMHSISYRFVPFADESVQSSIFATALVNFKRKNMAPGAKFQRRQSFVSLSHEVKATGVTISIKDIPSGPIALKLLKRNLSIHQKNFDVVTGDLFLLDGKSNAPLSIDDGNVKQGRIYEYQVALIYKDGDQEIGSNNLVVNYNPVVSNIVTTTVLNPEVVQQSAGFDVTFTVQYNILNQNAELVKKFITEQNLLNEFQTDITDNKSELTKLFAYSVVRNNLTSGEVESFGIIDSLNFSDRRYGIPKNVRPLDPGSEYRYVVTTYFRNPETLFPTLERTIETTNGSYTFKPYKWRQPITLKEGNLVTANSLKRNHAQSQFAQGELADIQNVNISLASLLPSLGEGQASQVREKANLIQWKVNGNVTKIDHFIVMLESLGIRTIVGCAHNISNSNYFEFLDVLSNGERGALTYFVVPVYYDYSRGTELKTNVIVI
ncbi:MAG: hypothetical protein WC761_00690 [Candidatus Paceibacterota bacterium]|jgi:hypothetical protein